MTGKKIKIICSAFILLISFAGRSLVAQTGQISQEKNSGSPGTITLSQALKRAFKANPGLAAARREVERQEALDRQAGLLPNPEFLYEAENFGGNSELKGTGVLESTFSLNQEIELGGKRGRRKKLANLKTNLARLELESRILDLAAVVKSTFAEFLAAQLAVDLAREKTHLAREVYNTVSSRVSAGKVSPVELTKAGVVLASVQLGISRTEVELTALRQRLSTAWGAEEPVFEKAIGDLERLFEPKPLAELVDQIDRNPDLIRWQEEIKAGRAALALEKADRIPDLEIGAGIRRFSENGNQAFVLEAGIPIPLFNRNQGNIAAAEHEFQKTIYQAKENRARVIEALTVAHGEMHSAYNESVALRDRVVKGAESVFEATQMGYAQGKFGYLELLEAQKSLFEARGSYIDALARCHMASAKVDRLIGQCDEISAITGAEGGKE